MQPCCINLYIIGAELEYHPGKINELMIQLSAYAGRYDVAPTAPPLSFE